MQVDVNVDVAELLANIDKLPQELVDALSGAMEVALELIEGDAVDGCPKDSTALSTSLCHEVVTEPSAVRGFVGSVLDYAPYVHEGTGIYAKDGNGRQTPWAYEDDQGQIHWTHGQHPKPFVQDAIDKNRAKILSCFEGVLGK